MPRLAAALGSPPPPRCQPVVPVHPGQSHLRLRLPMAERGGGPRRLLSSPLPGGGAQPGGRAFAPDAGPEGGPPPPLSSPLSGGRSGGGSRAGARVGGGGSSPRPPFQGGEERVGRRVNPLPTSPLPGGRSESGGTRVRPRRRTGRRDLKCDCPACEPEAPFSNRFPCPWQRERAEGARVSPLFAGLSRSIPVYPGLSRFIPVDSGLSWSVPVYSGPSRPVPVAGGRKRMRSAVRRMKGAARTAAPCRERRRVRGSPTPFGPRAVDGVHAPVDSICSPPGQPRSSRVPGRPHLEISGRRAVAAVAGRGARGRHLLSSLEGGEE